MGITLLSAAVLLLASIRPAHAYIDPGSGSYVFQMALAGILAVAYSVKLFWTRIRASIASMVHAARGHQHARK